VLTIIGTCSITAVIVSIFEHVYKQSQHGVRALCRCDVIHAMLVPIDEPSMTGSPAVSGTVRSPLVRSQNRIVLSMLPDTTCAPAEVSKRQTVQYVGLRYQPH
jgi:hypothetical protein